MSSMPEGLKRSLLASANASNMQNQPIFINGKPHRNVSYCHELVRETAKALAGEIYESAMRFNDNYDVWKRMCPDLSPEKLQAEFIKLMWPRMLGDARATLAKMLAEPIAESLKEQIYRALILDGQIRAKGKPPRRMFKL